MNVFSLIIYTAIIVLGTDFVEALVNYLMMKKIQKMADDKGIDINGPAHYYCFYGQVALMGFWEKFLIVIGIKEFVLVGKYNNKEN